MNKINQYLVPASLAALVFALLGGLWLVWQTIEESRALERHNRELQASLEASRIRVANFCEYPTDVLCRTDERSGLVAGALPGEFAGLPAEEHQLPVPAVEIIPARKDSPALAIEHVEKTAKAQAEVQAQALPPAKAPELPISVEETPADAMKTTTPAEEKLAAATETPTMPAAPSAPAPAAAVETETILDKASKADTPAPADAVLPDAKLDYRHEIAGKLAPEPIAPEEEKAAEPAAVLEKSGVPEKQDAPAAVQLPKVKKSAEPAKKTWSRVELDGDIFVFTLTGSGPSLPVKGSLLSSPMRYELQLKGHWEIRQHPGISHRLVERVSTKHAKGDTIVTFHLKAKPYRSSLHRPDERTVSVRIR